MRPAEPVTVEADDGLGEVLPVPARETPAGLHGRVAGCLRRGVPLVVATVVARHGSAPATPGQKLVLTADGECAGTVGGGALERAVLLAMRARLDERSPAVLTFALGASLGMCCGGRVEVLVEPLAAARPVGIVGAGHVATALAPLLVRVGFAVTVADDREAWSDPARLPDVALVHGDFASLADHVDPRGALIVMTHDHRLDQDAIEWALRRGYALVGGVGSRAKAARTRDRLAARGFSPDDLARVRMPLGVAIGARLPDEIAVSIAAELIAWARGIPLPGSEDERAAPRSRDRTI
jgi:xanthine dehydrogenase accessory factor